MSLPKTLTALLLALGLVLVGCGDDGSGADLGVDGLGGSESADDGGDDAGDDGVGESGGEGAVPRGGVADASIELSGTVDDSYTPDRANLDFLAAGGCQAGAFGLQLQANDAEIGQTLARVLFDLDADLSGGATGTFDIEDLAVEVFEPGDITQVQSFDGPGTLEITEHDTEADAPRMVMTITGEDLQGEDDDGITIEGATVDLDTQLDWVFSC